ncbi:MAG TPA: RNA-binding protein [Clostridiales bacterium]|nr:RNA-binding protein [Clostridiales bacterium]
MCEANVYMRDETGHDRLFMEHVDIIIPGPDGLYMENIFGERKKVDAVIQEMQLVSHRIILSRPGSA